MHRRALLVLAVASGALAVALVAVDVAFGLEVQLQVQATDGSWQTVFDDAGLARPVGPGCSGRDFRLVVRNGQPWGTSVPVYLAVSDANGTRVLVHDTWTLGGGETRMQAFTVTASTTGAPEGGKPAPMSVSIEGQVGKTSVYGCGGLA